MARPILDDVTQAIGGTPLIRLSRLAADVPPAVLGKFEPQNPGGSFKDRAALSMIEDAEARGVLGPGGTIVEGTAGNTGVGLAQAAAVRGYRCVFVMPDKMSREKQDLLRAYGAEVVVTATVGREDPRNYHNLAEKIARETPGGWFADQFGNPANPRAYHGSVGPEIWEDTAGRIEVFVAGMGTCGMISGAGRFLKDRGVRVVGVDPEGSGYSGACGSYKVEGIGGEGFPPIYDAGAVDAIERVSDAEAFAMARRLARTEGILAGGSTGAVLVGALRVAATMREGQTLVAVLCDTGRNYLSKLFDDGWMKAHGF